MRGIDAGTFVYPFYRQHDHHCRRHYYHLQHVYQPISVSSRTYPYHYSLLCHRVVLFCIFSCPTPIPRPVPLILQKIPGSFVQSFSVSGKHKGYGQRKSRDQICVSRPLFTEPSSPGRDPRRHLQMTSSLVTHLHRPSQPPGFAPGWGKGGGGQVKRRCKAAAGTLGHAAYFPTSSCKQPKHQLSVRPLSRAEQQFSISPPPFWEALFVVAGVELTPWPYRA